VTVNSAKGRSSLAWLCLLLLGAGAAHADHPVSMWQVDGGKNRVFLLGSVHLLRAADHPIPPVIYSAYEEAETLLMEMDMDDVDMIEAQALITELGLIQEGGSLREMMGPGAWSEAEKLAGRANIPLAMLASSKPWLAAITVEQLMLTRIGFDPSYGIESHMADRAAADKKEILGLETVRQQLEFLDNMSLDSQRALLLQSLEESIDLEAIMDELVGAWRHGDIQFLEHNMLEEIREHPELYDTIVVERNRDWVVQIEELLGHSDDYLVIVGALHLIGEQGVPALLSGRGYDVAQMQQAEEP
jgi:uncharacterized protein YbaP (TraB family)